MDAEIRGCLFTIYDLLFTTAMNDKDVIKETKPRMESAIEDFKRKLGTVRTGRASVSLLDAVMIDYYGTPTPLNQMASVHAPEPQMLTVQPWDPTQLGNVEKAIRAADLGLNPSNDGKLVRIPIPPLTEERRKQLAKQIHEIAEEHRTGIRNIRRDENDKLKKMLKDKTISEDSERDGLEQIQKLTDTYITKIDELSKSKEREIMSV
ncbi:MAG TPA: ribosome recycling factor [Pyrinomonadaceae bacterium]|jgi:ribosome recycling factor|nr:ribosome recycling factor [Pyrinomonadaceae bacterium]